MKKKLFASAFALIFAATACAGLTACGGGSSEGSSGVNAEEVKGEEVTAEQWVAGEVKGEEVTAEQWAAAFAADNFENVKMNYSTKETRELVGAEATQTMDIKMVVAGKLEHASIEYKGTGVFSGIFEGKDSEAYYSTEEDVITVYYPKQDGEWTTTTTDYAYCSMVLQELIDNVADMYESYEYSEEHKGHVPKDGKISSDAPILKFKSGKLAAMYAEELSSDFWGGYSEYYTGTYSYSAIFTYGGQKIVLPKEGEKDSSKQRLSEEVTAEQWAAAFERENFENCKIGYCYVNKEGDGLTSFTPRGVLLVAGDVEVYIEYFLLETSEEYYRMEDGSVVECYKSNGEWVKKTLGITEMPFEDAYSNQIQPLAEQYTGYEYSAEYGGYIPKDGGISLDAPLIKFKNGKVESFYYEDGRLAQRGTYFIYGGQEIALPEVD